MLLCSDASFPGVSLTLANRLASSLTLAADHSTVTVQTDAAVIPDPLIPILRGPRGATGPVGPTSGNVDGGNAYSVYAPNQHIDGGDAFSSF